MKKIALFFRNFFSNNEGQKLTALSDIGKYLFPDYRFCWPHMDWWKNEKFNKYLDKFDEREGFNTHRRWMLHQLLRLTEGVPGDTAECGVYLGSSSFLICEANKSSELNRTHHCFDSFQGLSEPAKDVDGQYWGKGYLSVAESNARSNLAPFDNVKFYKGWIPERFNEVGKIEFSFVHIDVDLYEPTKDSIEFFYARMNEGAVCLCDDYGFNTCPGATKAMDEFLSDKPEKMLAMDSGSGFFIKGVKTGKVGLT